MTEGIIQKEVQNSQLVRKVGEEIKRLYGHKEVGAVYDLRFAFEKGVFSLQYQKAKFEVREVVDRENIVLEFVMIPDDEKKSRMYQILSKEIPSNNKMNGRGDVSVQTTEINEGEFIVRWQLKKREVNYSDFANFVKGHVLRHFFGAAYLVAR